MIEPDLLLDVSRLIWRVWAGRLPTGIDRVCHAYLDHFGPRALAVLQRRQLRVVLSPGHSQRLFALLREGHGPGPGLGFRRKLVRLLAQAVLMPSVRPDTRGWIYLNVGHTGLDAPGYAAWLSQQRWKPVFMVHDLIPISHPQFCRPGEAERHALRIRAVVQSAAGVIVNSAATGDAFCEFGVRENAAVPPVAVAWLATNTPAEPAPLAAPTRPTFVVIGTLEARKNHILLLSLWERLSSELGDNTPELVLIGQRGWEADDVFALLDGSPLLKGHVRELAACDDTHLLAWLRHARALLMPSFVEGFGIPVIEALEAGTPVIASDQPVFREIAGDIPLYLNPADGPGWEAAVREYCADSTDRARQLSAIRSYRRFTWNDHFRKVDDWLAEI